MEQVSKKITGLVPVQPDSCLAAASPSPPLNNQKIEQFLALFLSGTPERRGFNMHKTKDGIVEDKRATPKPYN